MSSKTHHFRIGLFVLVGALLFIGALFAMGLKSYFGKRDVFETSVTGKVDNLSVGALVKLRGVTIGKVSFIDFVGAEYPEYKEQYVIIQFEVPKGSVWSGETGGIQETLNVEAEHGLRARVQGQGFLGANIVALEYVDTNLYPIEPIPWTPKHYYIPSAPSQFNRVITSLEKSLYHAENLDLTNLLAKANVLIDSFNQLARNVNHVDFNTLGTNVDTLLVELRETNHGLQRTLDGAQKTLADAQNAINGADIPAISRDTVALETKLTSTAMELRHTIASVDTGELNSSLANVRAATDELIALLHTLEQRPSSVLFSKPPEPVSELEKPPKK